MNISKLSERIVIQKNAVTVDAVGNHKNEWTVYFSCSAYVAGTGYKQSESENAGVISAADSLSFTVRYCSELTELDSTHYRLVFRGAVYNITSVDMMNYGRKAIKLTATKEVR